MYVHVLCDHSRVLCAVHARTDCPMKPYTATIKGIDNIYK